MAVNKKGKVNFYFLTPIPLKRRLKLKRFIREIFITYNLELASISYVFCSDEYLLQINQKYLGHDTLTDIITFPLSREEQPVQAEVYISADRVKENAIYFKVSLEHELHRVLFHGALHLCGLKDKTKEQKKKMRLAEDELVNLYLGST